MIRWIRRLLMNARLKKARARLPLDHFDDGTASVRFDDIEPYGVGYKPVRGEVLLATQRLKGGRLYLTNTSFAVQGESNYRKGWKSIGDVHFLLDGYKVYPRNGRARFFAWKRFEPDTAVMIDVLLAQRPDL